MVRFDVLKNLEEFHLFKTNNETLVAERSRWLAKYSKQSGQIALESVVNSLIVSAMAYLKDNNTEETYCYALKSLSYLFMSSLAADERFNLEDLTLITTHLKKAIEAKKVR